MMAKHHCFQKSFGIMIMVQEQTTTFNGYKLKLNIYVRTHPNVWNFITKIKGEVINFFSLTDCIHWIYIFRNK